MGHVIWTMKEAREVIDKQENFWLSDCSCREGRGNKCKKGQRVCLGFSEQATSTSTNRGRVDKAEVEKLLKFAAEEELVPRPFVDEDGRAIAVCFCCPCCCDYILGKPGTENVAGKSIERTDRSKCTACGSCVDICYFGARKIENGALKIDSAKCYGCGLCVDACAPGAVTMTAR